MEKFWKKSKVSQKYKIVVFNSICRSKLMYGLETLQMSKAMTNRLDSFQCKGFRKILKWKSTYIDRENTNNKIIREANRIMMEVKITNSGKGNLDSHDKVIKFSQ